MLIPLTQLNLISILQFLQHIDVERLSNNMNESEQSFIL